MTNFQRQPRQQKTWRIRKTTKYLAITLATTSKKPAGSDSACDSKWINEPERVFGKVTVDAVQRAVWCN